MLIDHSCQNQQDFGKFVRCLFLDEQLLETGTGPANNPTISPLVLKGHDVV